MGVVKGEGVAIFLVRGHRRDLGGTGGAEVDMRIISSVTVWMDPYPFPHVTPHVTTCTTLRIVSRRKWHDLMLDHANGQSISLSIALSLFSWTEHKI